MAKKDKVINIPPPPAPKGVPSIQTNESSFKVNFPPKVRAGLYIITALGTPLMGVLSEQHFVPDWAMTLWTAEVAAVSAMAALNVTLK